MDPWNCRPALTISLWINLCRQYEPFLSSPLTVNPGSWLTTEVGNINPMKWPVQVQYLNPIFRYVALPRCFTSRWTDFHIASADMLDAWMHRQGHTWLEDEDLHPGSNHRAAAVVAWR